MHLSFCLASAFGIATVVAVPTSTSCQSGAVISGTTCTQECNIDRNGGDFNSLAVSSFADCALACSQNDRCLTAQYNRANGYCYLKSTLNGRSSNNNVDGVVCRQPAAVTTTSSAAGSCPTAVPYTSPSGVSFEYTCGLDYFGGDLRTVYSIPSIGACLDACAAEPSCLRVTWHSDSNTCYLKNGQTTDRLNPGEYAGKRITTSSTTTSSSTTTTSSSTTTKSSTTTTTTTAPTTTTTTTTSKTTTTSSTTSVAPFSCPTEGYMVTTANGNPPALFKVDIATGQKTLIKSGLTDGATINAIGYNALDNKLYGVLLGTSTSTIIQIGSNGATSNVRSIPNSNSGGWNTGDVDENGDFWIAASGTSWLQVNLASGQTKASGTASIPYGVYDWAYVPGGGNYLYSAAVDSTGKTFLYRFDRSAKTWALSGTGYGVIFPSNGVVGAVYASQDGFLYASENTGGKIYKLSLDGKTATYVTTGPTASSNDGAHCINNVANA